MARKPAKANRSVRAVPAERSEGGVDLTLIRWMLALSPAERLRAAQGSARFLLRLRAGRANP